PSGWLGAETYPGKKENRHRAAVSERFPAITEWPAGIPSSRNSTVGEAQTAVDRPVAPCALLWPGRKRQRLWMDLERISQPSVSAQARNLPIGAGRRCRFRSPTSPDPAAHQARPGP